MGATIHTDCRVFALPKVSGIEQQYILDEQTYDQRTYPHTPRWCTQFMGTYNECMRYIVKGSSYVESGSLRIFGCNGTPSSYIQRWRKAFANVFAICPDNDENHMISVQFGPGTYQIPVAQRNLVLEVFHTHCGLVIDDHKEAESLTLNLQLSGVQRALQLLTQSANINACFIWILFRGLKGVPAADLSINPVKIKHVFPKVEIYNTFVRFPYSREVFVFAINESITSGGTIETFIREYVAEAEFKQPGTAEELIAEFSKKIKGGLTELPDNTEFIIYKDAYDEYQGTNFKMLCDSLGVCESSSIRATLSELKALPNVFYNIPFHEIGRKIDIVFQKSSEKIEEIQYSLF